MNKETPPQSIEDQKEAISPELEEMVFHAHDGAENGNHSSDEVRDEIERSEIHGYFSKFESGEHLNLDRLSQSIEAIVSRLEEEVEHATQGNERVLLQNEVKYFQGRNNQISYAIQTYVDTIAAFERMKANRAFMEERDYQDKIVAIDADRRRRHDALMESLLTMTQKVHELIKEGYLDEEEIYWWKGAHDSLLVNGTEKLIVLFDVSVPTHANRKQIQDWAIAADLSINLRIIKAREKKNQG